MFGKWCCWDTCGVDRESQDQNNSIYSTLHSLKNNLQLNAFSECSLPSTQIMIFLPPFFDSAIFVNEFFSKLSVSSGTCLVERCVCYGDTRNIKLLADDWQMTDIRHRNSKCSLSLCCRLRSLRQFYEQWKKEETNETNWWMSKRSNEWMNE